MKLYLKLLVIIVIEISCGKANTSILDNNSKKDSIKTKKNQVTSSPQKCDYENDLVSTVFVQSIGLNTFLEKDSTKVKKIKNTHDPEILDIEISFKNNSNYYKFYISETDTFLTEAVIKTKTDNTIKEIQIGCKQESVSNYFNIKDVVCDTLVLCDLEKYTYLTFCFKNQLLSKLILKSRVD